MLYIKQTKRNIISRLNAIDSSIMSKNNKPSLIIISTDKQNGWRILQYYKINNSKYDSKEVFCNDYKGYLDNMELDKTTTIILNDLPA
jgi:hypothetical protein